MQFTEALAVALRAPGGSGGAAQPGRYLLGRAGDHVQLGGELEGVPLKRKHAAASTAGSRLATVERGAAQGSTVRCCFVKADSGDCAATKAQSNSAAARNIYVFSAFWAKREPVLVCKTELIFVGRRTPC